MSKIRTSTSPVGVLFILRTLPNDDDGKLMVYRDSLVVATNILHNLLGRGSLVVLVELNRLLTDGANSSVPRT